ncbi:MAG: hypothetical protein P8Z40_11185 [Chloroflexota bacterium]
MRRLAATRCGAAFAGRSPRCHSFALREFRHGLDTLDELQRRIQLEAFAFSLGCTSMLAFAYGMLEAFGGEPHVSLIFVLPVAAIFWGVGAVLARRRYQ